MRTDHLHLQIVSMYCGIGWSAVHPSLSPLCGNAPKAGHFLPCTQCKSIEVRYAQSIQLLFLEQFHQGDPAVLFKIPKGMIEIEKEMRIAHFLNLRRKGMRLFMMR